MGTSTKTQLKLATLRTVTVLMVGVAVLMAPSVADASLVVPAAPLPIGGVRAHPALAGPPPWADKRFNIYTGASLSTTGWTSVATLTSPFAGSEGIAGVFNSEVWSNNADGHLLFAYMIENDGTTDITSGDILDYEDANVSIIDSCVLHIDGDGSLANSGPYDIVEVSRVTNGLITQLRYYFAGGALGGNPLPPNQESTWFYLETDATDHNNSVGTLVGNGGAFVNNVPVLVPLPEPGTLTILAVAGLIGCLRKKRTH